MTQTQTVYADTALIVVDVQPDFLPGGALPCHDGAAILAGIAAAMASVRYAAIVATQDWHPAHHRSFASQHSGHRPLTEIKWHGQRQMLWPDHCVQGSPGAQLHPQLNWDHAHLILRKGMDPDVDSYSGFRDNIGAGGQRKLTGLSGWLRERNIARVHVCGLARDYCVLWTAQDAVAAGFRVDCLWDLTRPVTPASDPATRRLYCEHGITVI